MLFMRVLRRSWAIGLAAGATMAATLAVAGHRGERVPGLVPPILNPDAGLMLVGPAAGTPMAGVRPGWLDRLTGAGGTDVRGNAWGLALAADPGGVDVAGRRFMGPVDLGTGGVGLEIESLSLPAFVPWPIGVTISTAQVSGSTGEPGTLNSDGPQGWNAQTTSRPELVLSGETAWIVHGPNRFTEYSRVSASPDVYTGVNGAAGLLMVQGTAPATYRLVLPDGGAMVFYGPGVTVNDGVVTHAVGGQLWKVEGPGGACAFAGHGTDPATAAVLGFGAGGEVVLARDSAGREFAYTYTGSAVGSRVRVDSVVVRSGPGGAALARVDYDYYGEAGTALWGTSGLGSTGDLGLITVTIEPESATPMVRRTHVRYGQSGVSGQRAHGPRLVLRDEGYRRAKQDFAGDAGVMQASDEQLGAYSDFAACYGADGRVVAARFDGLAPSVGSVWGTHQFSYATSAAGTWRRRTQVEYPDASGDPAGAGRLHVTQFFDALGQPLSTVLSEGVLAGGGLERVHGVQRDVLGRLSKLVSPSGCWYDAATGEVAWAADAGLFTVVERMPSSADPEANALAGLVRGVRLAHGDAASAPSVVRTWRLMEAEVLDCGAVGLAAADVTAVREYHAETGDASAAGTYDEWGVETTYYAGTLVPRKVRVTQPVVTTAQHGENAALATEQHYRPDGTPLVHVSQAGRLTYTKFDPVTGRLARRVIDAGSAEAESLPAGVAANGGAYVPYHVGTTLQYDALGRLSRVLDAGGRNPGVFYAALADGRMAVMQVPRITATTYEGPTSVSVIDQAGNVQAAGVARPGVLSILGRVVDRGAGARPELEYYAKSATAPTGWLSAGSVDAVHLFNASQAAWLSLSTAEYTPGGARVSTAARYPWVQGAPSGSGADDAPIVTSVCYDGLGRVKSVTDGTGTVDTVGYDALGRVISNGRGVAGQVLDEWRRFEYSSDGLVTRVELSPGGGAGVRTTDVRYDWRQRVKAIAPPMEPFTLVDYDNLDRVVAAGVYGGDRGSLLGYQGGALAYSSAMLAGARLRYDALGRVYQSERLAGGASEPPLVTDHWFGRHGNLLLSKGETIVKHEYDHTCQCVATHVLAATGAEPAYGEVKGITARDIVLESQFVVRDRRTGDPATVIRIARDPAAPQAGGGVVLPDRFGALWAGFNPSYDGLAPGAITLPAERRFLIEDWRQIVRGKMGEVRKEVRLGDPRACGEAEDRTICCGETCTLPVDIPARTTEIDYDDRLIPIFSRDPSGRTNLTWPDDLGRPFKVIERKIPLPEGQGCPPGTERRYVYDGDRLRRIAERAFDPGARGPAATRDTTLWYADDGLTPPGGAFGALPKNNRLPVAMAYPAHPDDLAWTNYNRLGEATGWVNPRGIRGQVVRDVLGRITTELDDYSGAAIDPALLAGLPVRREYTFDALGRVAGAQSLRAGGAVASEMAWTYSPFGSLASQYQRIVDGTATVLNFANGVDPTVVSEPGLGTIEGWRRERRQEEQLCMGLSCDSRRFTNVPWGEAPLGPMSEPDINRLIGRPEILAENNPNVPLDPNLYVDQVNSHNGIDQPIFAMIIRVNDLYPIDTPNGRFPMMPAPQEICSGASGDCRGITEFPPADSTRDCDSRTRPGLDAFREVRHDLIAQGPTLWNIAYFPDVLTEQPPAEWQYRKSAPDGETIWMVDPMKILPGIDWGANNDHQCGPLIWSGVGYGQPAPGPARGPGVDREQQRHQAWGLDAFGNWETFIDRRSGLGRGAPALGPGDIRFATTYNDADQEVTREGKVYVEGAPGDAVTVQVPTAYDACGNLVDDGLNFGYEYDAENRLIAVYHRDAAAPDHRGALYGVYTYNALGWRTSAVYDRDGDGALHDDYVEHYAYDEQWRVIAVYRQAGVASAGTTRPAPVIDERYRYQMEPRPGEGAGGAGGVPYDRLLARYRSTGHNGVLDEELFYRQNAAGDVIALARVLGGPALGGGVMPNAAAPAGGIGEESRGGGPRGERGGLARGEPEAEYVLAEQDPLRVSYAVERYRYLAYGSPLCFPAADVNLDGKVDYDDNFAFGEYYASHDRRADINNNGRIDTEPEPAEGPNEIQVPVWDGSDSRIFAAEYLSTFLAYYDASDEHAFFYGDGDLRAIERDDAGAGGVHEKQVRALGILSQPEKPEGFYPTVGVNNRFGYRGYWYEPEIGKYLCRNRVYDPRFGRWLTRDPIGYAGGWNLYRYCEGRPLNFRDPMGLDPNFTDLPFQIKDGYFDTVVDTGRQIYRRWYQRDGQTVATIYWAANGNNGSNFNGQEVYGEAVADKWASTAELFATVQGIASAAHTGANVVLAGGEIGIRIALTPVDLVLSAGELIEDPSNPLNWIGLLPAFGKGAKFVEIVIADGSKAGRAVKLAEGEVRALAEGKAAIEVAENGAVQVTRGDFTARYLAGSGGRWGAKSTRQLNYDIATAYVDDGWKVERGGGYAKEEYIPGIDGGAKGSTYVDITLTKNGKTLRIQTVDTLSDGITPTRRELDAAERIRNRFPNDELILHPKSKPACQSP